MIATPSALWHLLTNVLDSGGAFLWCACCLRFFCRSSCFADFLAHKNLLLKMKTGFINAGSAWEAYMPMDENNSNSVGLVWAHLSISEEVNAQLMSRIPASWRRNSRASSTIVAYHYLRRGVSHFCKSLAKAANTAFVSSINDSTGMDRQVLVAGNRTRTVPSLTREEAVHLLTGDRLISEAFGKSALLAAASNMCASLGAAISLRNQHQTTLARRSCASSGKWRWSP